ncbi:DsbA family oxidoreductase [Marinoscillum sp. MHG1-6]|uniref:DsbA family oxidoreductase n=1 Tax=Marinoscillum sp. MHG1-6 TaxID=2959627 RepID=UPI00215713A7|nr:DsbA family oxidoreductase [Marinoscillum sp. MHG1-6]
MFQDNPAIKIEIWSDIACPFCYIGHHNLHKALEGFEHSNEVSVEYKSYQLSPNTITDPTLNSHQYLARHKGVSVEEALRMNSYVEEMGKKFGVWFNFDRVIPANTLRAHMLLHLAKATNKQEPVKKALFEAHFVNGKNIDDFNVLMEIGQQNGFTKEETEKALSDQEYGAHVREDIREAMSIGVKGVPFFVINRKYGISGAHPVEYFSQALNQSYKDVVNQKDGK